MTGSLVDVEALSAFLAERLGVEASISVTRHRAGHSNETFFVDYGERRLVLRRPPLGAFLPTAHDVGREYRVTSALQDTVVRVPRTVLMCEDGSIIGAPFYLMERIDGVVVRDELPELFEPGDRRAIGLDLVDALVELHSIDPASCGLAGFGRSSGYLERQLRRWGGQLELTIPHSRPLPELEEVGSWLLEHVPRSQATAVVHGDYKLDNVMLAPHRPGRIVAILDWEMSTLGDPLADVGWMLSSWRDQGDDRTGVFAELNRVTELPGFPSRHELAERYADRTGLDLERIDWYEVLAVYKMAVLLEGSYARHLAGVTDDPFFARLDEGVPELARSALQLIER